jgi:rhamnulokinase
LTNIMGLWLVQECRRVWARSGMSWSYEELTARAAAVPSPGVVLDVDDPAFLHPADMPAAINGQLARTGQKTMQDPVELVRAIFEGLALKYRVALERAEQLSGTRVRVIHVVGGGARNELLCQLTADACGRSVAAGPAEATALGNVLVQAMGRGEVRSLAEAHAIARSSAAVRVHEPRISSQWDELHARLVSLA